MMSGRNVRAKPRANRLMILARRPFGFTRECETSASREERETMLFVVKWKYLLKAARKCARCCTLLETPTKSRKL